jgi:predicted nucleotidyltransferase
MSFIDQFLFVEPRVYAVLGQAGVESTHGGTATCGRGRGNFEGAFGFGHKFPTENGVMKLYSECIESDIITVRLRMATKAPRVRISIPKRKIQEFCHRYDVQRMALFGSVLNKNFRPESDVDVLVAFTPNAHIGFLTLSRMQRELSELFKRPVDLVPMDGLKPVIRDSVLSNIEVVYAA